MIELEKMNWVENDLSVEEAVEQGDEESLKGSQKVWCVRPESEFQSRTVEWSLYHHQSVGDT